MEKSGETWLILSAKHGTGPERHYGDDCRSIAVQPRPHEAIIVARYSASWSGRHYSRGVTGQRSVSSIGLPGAQQSQRVLAMQAADRGAFVEDPSPFLAAA